MNKRAAAEARTAERLPPRLERRRRGGYKDIREFPAYQSASQACVIRAFADARRPEMPQSRHAHAARCRDVRHNGQQAAMIDAAYGEFCAARRAGEAAGRYRNDHVYEDISHETIMCTGPTQSQVCHHLPPEFVVCWRSMRSRVCVSGGVLML